MLEIKFQCSKKRLTRKLGLRFKNLSFDTPTQVSARHPKFQQDTRNLRKKQNYSIIPLSSAGRLVYYLAIVCADGLIKAPRILKRHVLTDSKTVNH